jgi:GMP synthase PP-ATPase subunit
MINNGNINDNCVKERIHAGNRAHFANLSTLKSKIISRAAKIYVYKTLIRPVATYEAKTRTLTVTEVNALRMFERKIIRRIYGPVMENNVWRVRYNEEINTLLKGEDIVRCTSD